MNWHSFISTLLGGFITFCAILFTNVLDLRKRKRTHDALIHALLQGLQDEIGGLLEMAETSPVRPIQAVTEGKPYRRSIHRQSGLLHRLSRKRRVGDADRGCRLAPKHHSNLHARESSPGHCEHEPALPPSVFIICKAPSSKPRTVRFRQNPRTIAERWCRSPGSSSRPMRSSGERQPACWKCSHARSGPN